MVQGGKEQVGHLNGHGKKTALTDDTDQSGAS